MDVSERQIGELTIAIRRDTCIGSGNCAKVAPEVFHLDDEALAAFNEDAGEASIDQEQLLEACRVCPVQALIAIDRNGEQLVP